MASGKAHAIATWITAGVASVALIYGFDTPFLNAAAFSGGCLLGLIINPDLDIEHPTIAHAMLRRSFGGFSALLWRAFWWPYAWFIPHRSPLSHFPVLGTLLRLIYLLGIPALIWLGLAQFYPLGALPEIVYSPLWFWAVGGLMVVDSLHAVMDWI